jgi:hypothetical protein
MRPTSLPTLVYALFVNIEHTLGDLTHNLTIDVVLIAVNLVRQIRQWHLASSPCAQQFAVSVPGERQWKRQS